MATPRATWKGHLKLALLSCPVRLYKATGEAEKLSSHFLHRDTRNRIQMIPHEPSLGKVDRSDLVTAYKHQDRYVVLSDQELAEIEAPSDKTLLIESFVAASDIDPLFLDQPFFLAPDGALATEAFDVLRTVMATRRKAALGRIVLNRRERMAAITARDRGFILTTLRSADEVRSPGDFFRDLPSGNPSTEIQNLAEQLIAMRSGRFDPHVFKDRYQAALKDLIEQKVMDSEAVDQRNGAAPARAAASIDPPPTDAANDDEIASAKTVAEAFRLSVDRQRKPPAKSRSRSGGRESAAGRSKTAAKSPSQIPPGAG